MQILSFTDARNNLTSVLNKVEEDADYTIIHRRDRQDAVVMGLDYFNAMVETLHLLKSPANAARLANSIKQIEDGKGIKKELINE